MEVPLQEALFRVVVVVLLLLLLKFHFKSHMAKFYFS
jgi:hypothetical protein